MKVKLLKDLPHCKAWEYEVIKDGEVYLKDINNNLNLSIIFNWWLYNKDFFERISEDTEFKIWDKIIYSYCDNDKIYWIISWYDIVDNTYCINWYWLSPEEIELCTDKEIKLYFN
jgi:hypothetical protein